MQYYRLGNTLSVAKIASRDITDWLELNPQTVRVVNVEKDKQYRELDVDLIWVRRDGEVKIEVKGDRRTPHRSHAPKI